MSNSPALAQPGDAGDIIESVIAKGDLAKLSPQERTRYYVEVCRSVGLNPLTKPMEYITLNGRMVLYALRNCTDQLRTNRGVSVEDMTESEREGVYVVTCKVKDKDGRTDMAKGAVSIAGLKGEALANAIMKCETKAKRRATLSICGLGMLDESEVESVPVAMPSVSEPAPQLGPKVNPLPASKASVGPLYDPETGEVGPHYIALGDSADRYLVWGKALIAALAAAKDAIEGESWVEQNDKTIAGCKEDAPSVARSVTGAVAKMRQRFSQPDFMPAVQ